MAVGRLKGDYSMIAVKNSEVSIVGRTPNVLAEYTLLTKDLEKLLAKKYGEEFARKKIDGAIEDSRKTPEQLNAEIKDAIKNLKDEDVAKCISAIFEAMKEAME